MYESELENYVVNKTKRAGGKAFKWVCPGQTGVPDRICIFPGGKIIFIELKRPGLKDGRSERQKKMFKLLQDLGCDVRLVSDKKQFKELLWGIDFKEVAPHDV